MANLTERLCRIRRGTYKPHAARLVQIPKEDGSLRPLAISCFEDKIVQLAMSKILEAIFEPLFLNSSFGYRPHRNPIDALRTLQQAQWRCTRDAVVEIDLQKYFSSVPHGPLMEFLKGKIRDSRLLSLIRCLIETPMKLDNGKTEATKLGVPQRSVLSPVLSNIYLHYVLDEWFESIKGSHLRGDCTEVRFADDVVFVFQYAKPWCEVCRSATQTACEVWSDTQCLQIVLSTVRKRNSGRPLESEETDAAV